MKDQTHELQNKSAAFVAETDFQVIQEIKKIEVINISNLGNRRNDTFLS